MDEELIVDVVDEVVALPSMKNNVVKRAKEAVLVDSEESAFEKVSQVRPAVMDEDGKATAFDPRKHVAFVVTDAVRNTLNGLIGKSQADAEKVVNELIENKKASTLRVVRLTETIDAQPVPGRVTLVLNFDKSVNAIDVE